MSRWWRAYDEAVDDPKLQCLSDECFRFWFNLCCVCSAFGGNFPSEKHLAFKLRMQQRKVARLLGELCEAGLIDKDNQGTRPHNWAVRQYNSDVSTDRVQRFRKRKRNVSSAVSETAPDTDTDTDTERKTVREARARRATRLEPEWWPSLENINYAIGKGFNQQRISVEAEKFRNYWIAKSGTGATKLDWDATWQNWILNTIERGGGPGNGRPNESLSDRAFRLAELARSAERARGVDRPAKPVGSD